MPAVTITETIGKMSTKYEFDTFQDYENHLRLESGGVPVFDGGVSLMGGGEKPPKQEN